MGIREIVEGAKARNPFPEGAVPIGVGLMVLGITSYGFLVIAARALSPENYSSLSVLWALLFLAAPGLFLPLEQEVGRALAARRSRGVGGRPVVVRAAVAGGLAAVVLGTVLMAASSAYLDRLFEGDALLMTALVIGIVGYFLEHLTRGTLSGNGRFSQYGLVVGSEGAIRLVACIALALVGSEAAGPFGLILGLAPFAAILIGLARSRDGLVSPGPEAPWSEMSSSLGYLLTGSLLSQGLINVGPLVVRLLAAPNEQALAGRFLAGLVIARVPLFLFQAVQAALLPKLSQLAAGGNHADFRWALKRLLSAVALIGAVGTLGAFAVGPWVVQLLFGREFVLGRVDLTYLASGSAAFMVALALAQALLALHSHARAALGWVIGSVIFVATVVFPASLLLRVERAYLIGAIGAAFAMGALLLPRLRAAGEQEGIVPENLLESAPAIPEFTIEP